MIDPSLWIPSRVDTDSAISVFTENEQKFVGWSRLAAEGTVRVDFPASDAPSLVTGVRADLVFSGQGDLRLFLPKARVVRFTTGPGHVSYVFEISDMQWRSVRDRLRPRNALRVQVTGSIPIDMACGEHSFQGTLDDLSEGGMGARIRSADEAFVAGLADVHLGFELPGDLVPFHFVAEVRDRSIASPGFVRCGLEFDSTATRRFDEQCQRIADYVRACRDSNADD